MIICTSSDDEEMSEEERWIARNKVLKTDIFSLLASTHLPLSAPRLRWHLQRIYPSKYATLSEIDVSRLCRALEDSDVGVVASWQRSYFLRVREDEMTRNALVAPDYQQLGMTVLRTPDRAFVYVPTEAEHRFVEPRVSTIPGAGLGLFVRPSRILRQGTIILEYRGRMQKELPKNSDLCPYTVALSNADLMGNQYIDALSAAGDVLCLAALINDKGASAANVCFSELPHIPGRVFVMTLRDIGPQEEVFVSYGKGYWERKRRSTQEKKNGSARESQDLGSGVPSRKRGLAMLPETVKCRPCGAQVPPRILSLHLCACRDSWSTIKLSDLNSLPFNEFTAVDDQQQHVWESELQGDIPMLCKRARWFVDRDDSVTYAYSHMDIAALFKMEVAQPDAYTDELPPIMQDAATETS